MPKGPQGQKRSADAIGRSLMVAEIAMAEIEDTTNDPPKAYHSAGGKEGWCGAGGELTP